ncbi:M20 family metallopeptidase [Micromonospora sp. NPDC050495]|uniref:M20 family metallopeptidase n=1 Tax=Micromonospora sp. NPDC050495 TaxID=3154936 RepID=UPI00340E3930
MTEPHTTPPNVREFVTRLPAMLDDLEALVSCESPSADRGAIARSAGAVAALGERLTGVPPERIVIGGWTHLRWRLGERPGVLLLGHHDTVWPIGSLATYPWSTEGGIVRGPGCFDMKAGIVQLFHAVAALGDPGGITILITGDEEVHSPTSRALIEDEARGCGAAFVLEAAAEGGALKTSRKGAETYQVHVHGRAAHAGLEPERGANAAVELARQVLAINELGDARLGTTVTPTLLSAGTTANTVPDSAVVSIDVRAKLIAEQTRVNQALHALVPQLAGTSLQVIAKAHRPPLEAACSADLFQRAQALADQLGLGRLDGVAVGGASDGNLTAAVGTPTLDGLGAVGGGAHSADEHVVIAELPRRTALLAHLIDDVRTRLQKEEA